MSNIAVVVIGLGPIGRFCTELALERRDLEVIGAVDVSPEMAGRDLGAVLGRPDLGVVVQDSIQKALPGDRAGVAILTTASDMTRVVPTAKDCLAAGWSVVSTCEELAYPWLTRPELSAELDQAAKNAGKAVLGTGVNPGFAMDALPAFLSGVMRRVDSVVVERFQDASSRRLPFQQKIGAGLSLDGFRDKVSRGIIRHVGFTESIHLIAAAWGVTLDRIEEQVRPVMATRVLKSQFMEVLPGQVAGVDQIAQGFLGDRAIITLNLQAFFGHPDPKERIRIQGEPPLELVIPGGVAGDVATCAMTVNAVYRAMEAPAGLRTMLDMAFPVSRRPKG